MTQTDTGSVEGIQAYKGAQRYYILLYTKVSRDGVKSCSDRI